MSKWTWSWPASWPDKSDDPRGSGMAQGPWNGYFGKDQFNADEESYFVADDYNKQGIQFLSGQHRPQPAGAWACACASAVSSGPTRW